MQRHKGFRPKPIVQTHTSNPSKAPTSLNTTSFVVRYVFGLVGREQGKSARGHRNESKKTHIVIDLVLLNRI
jgi:hypothetical protein